MKFNQYFVDCTYNGKIELSFKVTAANPHVALEIARSIVSNRYELELRVII